MQRLIYLFAAVLVAIGGFGRGAAAADDSAEMPKGEVLKRSFKSSKIFPGTERDYWIYVPRQYNPDKPACLHVNQDRIQFKAPEVFDRLIHEKRLPVIIGVFVSPGIVKAQSSQALDRYNRSYEYDGLGDNYVRFLLDELLPEVEKQQTEDGRPIRFSHDGNNRSIGGTSSGAICAFTAAWERPDSFSRVFSGIGTYVGLRGGNVYPTLVRKYEPKPLRVFLEDGSNDNNIYGGDWWMANQEMERALTFAGYEVEHNWGTGKHSAVHATEVFPEAIEWLWKNWPEPVKAGLGSSQLQQILIEGEGWKLVSEGYQFTEGPAANAQGEVFFNDVRDNKTYKIDADDQVSVFAEDTHSANGQAFGPDGKLYAIAAGSEEVVRYSSDGKRTVVAQGFRGNDIVISHAGHIYATAPSRDPAVPSRLWHITPAGEKHELPSEAKFPNGITLSPDQTWLYVADARSHWVYSYQVKPDGTLTNKQKYYHLHVSDMLDDSGADGMRVDREGRLYVATRLGVQVCDQAGRVNCIIPTPNRKIANLCFGGKNFDVIYATCGERIYKRRVKITGANAWLEPHKPAPPH
ncbi:MAG TPA: SMP-30/gluconolactonase/LRE family protein, partial [Pirellulales bacterium]|nr:SMP-30/gluconolactonase/LRE family protein [Pirellulales bacterium]